MPSPLTNAAAVAESARGSRLETLTSRVVCLLVAVVVNAWPTILARDVGNAQCIPMSTEVKPPSQTTYEILTALSVNAPRLGIHGQLNRACIGELTGVGAITSPGYPCEPRWSLTADDNQIICVWRLNAGSESTVASSAASGVHGRHQIWRVQLENLSSTLSAPGSMPGQVLAFDGFPPTPPYVYLTLEASNRYFDFENAATVVLQSTARAIARTKLLLSVSALSAEDNLNSPAATQSVPAQDCSKSASGECTCQPFKKTSFELYPPSEETRNTIKMVQALYENNRGVSANLTCSEELRGSGTIMSPNFPCIYPNHELCAWILFAGDKTDSPIAGVNPVDSSRHRRRRISLHFVDFDVEETYDPLLVFSKFPPSYETLTHTLSGRLSPNYTIVVNNENATLIFTSSKLTGRSGFLINFTTIIEYVKPVRNEPDRPNHETFNTTAIVIAVCVTAAVALGSAIFLLFAYRRRNNECRGRARKRAECVVAYTAKPENAAPMNGTLQHDSLSYKDGLVFGGSKRPDVLLLYCEDDRAHCAAVGALAALLRSLGGCDVRTINGTEPSLQNRQRDVRSTAIYSNKLRKAALRADRIIVFLSQGAELVEQAFLCGKVYPRLYRDSEMYMTVPHVIALCTECSAVRVKAVVVAYDFYQVHSSESSPDGNKSEAVNIIGCSPQLLSSTVVSQLGADVPVFRVLADMPRLIAALHSPIISISSPSSEGSSANALEQLLRAKPTVVWSCATEYEASNERRQLHACLAAVEQSEMQGERGNKLFDGAYGEPSDYCESIGKDATGSTAAMRQSVTGENVEQCLDGLTDVVTLPSLPHQRKASESCTLELDEASRKYAPSNDCVSHCVGLSPNTNKRDSSNVADDRSFSLHENFAYVND